MTCGMVLWAMLTVLKWVLFIGLLCGCAVIICALAVVGLNRASRRFVGTYQPRF